MTYTSIFADIFPDSFQRQYGEPIKRKISPSEVAMIVLIIEAIAIAIIAIVMFILRIIYYIITYLLWLIMSSAQTAIVVGLTLGVAAFVFFFMVGLIVSHFENKTAKVEVETVSNDNDNQSYMTNVVMPSGQKVLFPVPAKYCECKRYSSTKLIPLQADHKSDSEYKIISEEMNKTIKKHTSGSFSKCHIVSIQRVQNCCLWRKFRNRQFDIAKEGSKIVQRMLFHGTSAAEDLVKTGFDERHSNPNGMFGAGIYFAEHSSKSNQYVFGYMGGNGCKSHQNRNCTVCERKMLLCRVSLGNIHKLSSANKMSHPPPGYHSVAGVSTPPGQVTFFGLLFGGGLQYPEYVIYRGEQAYPEYLITYKIVI